MQAQVAADLYHLLSGAAGGTLGGKLYAAGDVPQGTELPFAYYAEAQNTRNNTTHDRKEGSHGVSRVLLNVAAESIRQARVTMAAMLSGAQNSGYSSIRRLVLNTENEGIDEIQGQEQPVHIVTAEFSVLYRIQ